MSRPTTDGVPGFGHGEGLREAGAVPRSELRVDGTRDQLAVERTAIAQRLARLRRQVGEEERDLARRRLRTVGAVDEVLGESRSRDRPRIVPGAASRGLVAPISVRTTFHVPRAPSTTIATSGPRVMNATRSSKKGLPSCSA